MKPKFDLLVLLMLTLATALLMVPRRALAVAEVKTPLPRLYYKLSEPVVVASVTKLIANQNPVAELRTVETVKGLAFPDLFRLQIVNQPDAMKNSKVGDPAVLFITKDLPDRGALHFADAWWSIKLEPGSQPPLWRANPEKPEAELPRTFPGRTELVVKLVAELKAGKSTLLNNVDNQRLRGKVTELCNLGVTKAAWIAAADVNGDKKPDLLVGAAGGAVKLFLAADAGGKTTYQDATAAWGLAGATGGRAVFGDVTGDGKLELLLGNAIWVNDGTKFAASKSPPLDLPPGATMVAAALADVNGDTKPDAVLLLGDGQLVTFANPGAADVPWAKGAARKLGNTPPLAATFGDWGESPGGKLHAFVVTDKAITRYPIDPGDGSGANAVADFPRITGEPITDQTGFDEGPLKVASAGALELNGDGRRDALILVDADGSEPSKKLHVGVALVSRGFGAFFADLDPIKALTGVKANPAPPITATAATPWAAADLAGDGTDDVLLLAEDGRLFVVDNPPAGKP